MMGKKSKKCAAWNPMPNAPWVYMNDPTENHRVTWALNQILPKSTIYSSPSDTDVNWAELLIATFKLDSAIPIVQEKYTDAAADLPKKLTSMNGLREAAVKCGSNFVSVNIYQGDGMGTKKKNLKKWGTNHLEIQAKGDEVKDWMEVAEKIYRWLFKVFTPHETLHLIPDEEMKVKDDKYFPDYDYCPINESKFRRKDAKIQFVAIVLSRPVVGPDQRLTWQVADKTGVANFYFQYRGSGSQYTWDWVLALQPGDRRALPRMPMVEIKERKRVKIAKAPFRGIGLAISGVGMGVRAIGHGVTKIGDAMKMGTSSQWVPEGDVVDGKVVDWKKVFEQQKAAITSKVDKEFERQSKLSISEKKIQVFNENGEKLWKDDDSVVSTEVGGEHINEKEFL